jgi:hypothetical protein
MNSSSRSGSRTEGRQWRFGVEGGVVVIEVQAGGKTRTREWLVVGGQSSLPGNSEEWGGGRRGGAKRMGRREGWRGREKESQQHVNKRWRKLCLGITWPVWLSRQKRMGGEFGERWEGGRVCMGRGVGDGAGRHGGSGRDRLLSLVYGLRPAARRVLAVGLHTGTFGHGCTYIWALAGSERKQWKQGGWA